MLKKEASQPKALAKWPWLLSSEPDQVDHTPRFKRLAIACFLIKNNDGAGERS